MSTKILGFLNELKENNNRDWFKLNKNHYEETRNEFKAIINSVDFKKLFGEIEGSKLVRPPVGFAKDFKDIELLMFKDYTIFHKINDKVVESPDFLLKSVNIFNKMNPFNEFLNRALSS